MKGTTTMGIQTSTAVPVMDVNNLALRYAEAKINIDNCYSRLISGLSAARAQTFIFADIDVFINSLQSALHFSGKLSLISSELRQALFAMEECLIKVKNSLLPFNQFLSLAFDKIGELANQPEANAENEKRLRLISNNAYKCEVLSYALSGPGSLSSATYQFKEDVAVCNSDIGNKWRGTYEECSLLVTTMEKISNDFIQKVSQIEADFTELHRHADHFIFLHSTLCQQFCATANCLDSFDIILSAMGIHINQTDTLDDNTRQHSASSGQHSSSVNDDALIYNLFLDTFKAAFIVPLNIKADRIATSIKRSYRGLKQTTTEYTTYLSSLNESLVSASNYSPHPYPKSDDLIKISSD